MPLATLPLNQKKHGMNSAVWLQGFMATASSVPTLILLGVKKQTVKEVFDEHNTSNTSVVGVHTFQKGKKHLEFTIEAELDAATIPDDAAGINMHADYFGFALVMDNSAIGSPSSASPGTIYHRGIGIGTIEHTADEGQISKYTITGKSSGPYITYNGS